MILFQGRDCMIYISYELEIICYLYTFRFLAGNNFLNLNYLLFIMKKVLLLASGGIDSPVAGYIMIKHGLEVIGIHFDNRPLIDYKPLEKTKRLLRKTGVKKLYAIKHGKIQLEIISHCFRRYQCVICRRMMFRIAERIARKEKCDFLVTGENLGQVASQTLDNMTLAAKAVKIPILRPLLCNDKQETVDLSKKIGTYDISIEPGTCCKAVPRHPITKGKEDKLKREELRINIKKLVNNAVSTAEIIYLERD